MSKDSVRSIAGSILLLVAAVALGLCITTFIGRIVVIDGSSMLPTLKNGDVTIAECITPRFGEVKQGDIVVLKIPEFLDGKKKYAVKRVIAVENQHVEIRDGKVFVDGTMLAEDYTNADETLADGSPYADMTVPEGCVYVLGDNRLPGKSRDSRTFGPVNEKRIVGKFWRRIFPFS